MYFQHSDSTKQLYSYRTLHEGSWCGAALIMLAEAIQRMIPVGVVKRRKKKKKEKNTKLMLVTVCCACSIMQWLLFLVLIQSPASTNEHPVLLSMLSALTAAVSLAAIAFLLLDQKRTCPAVEDQVAIMLDTHTKQMSATHRQMVDELISAIHKNTAESVMAKEEQARKNRTLEAMLKLIIAEQWHRLPESSVKVLRRFQVEGGSLSSSTSTQTDRPPVTTNIFAQRRRYLDSMYGDSF